MKPVYLDNNATTQVAPEVLETMLPYFHELYGNPSSMHSFGGQVMKEVRKAREQVAALLGASPDEIIFTSCGSESDNAAIRSALASYPDKRHIVTSRVEHPAVRALCAHLATQGYRVTELPVDGEGRLDMEQYRRALGPDTAIVSLMWANNETGVLFPVDRIAEICRSRGVLYHCDAVQAAGKVEIDVQRVPADYLSLTSHKFHAPKGIGALYVRRKSPFSPLVYGGHQERNRRGGTESVPVIVAMRKAGELSPKHWTDYETKLQPLWDDLEEPCTEPFFETEMLAVVLLTRMMQTMCTGEYRSDIPVS
ncbi:MAG: aminotransferase class V-fold PLP-dependent enzyme [Acidobacteriota bacterium]